MSATKNKLKIAFVLDTTLDSEDGVQQYILVLGYYLKSLGHTVHYIAGETHRTDIDNLHSMAKSMNVRFNGNKVIYPLPAKIGPIKKLLEKEKFDILHVQVPYSPLFAAKVVKYAPKTTAIVGTFHIFPFNKVAYFGTKALGLVLSKNLKNFHSHISVSKANQFFAKKTFKINSLVIPNMVDTNLFKPAKNFRSDKSTEILYLGRLTERKGCSYLINALSKLQQLDPTINFKLKIAGKGELLSKLQNLVESLSLSDNIEFLGYVDNDQKVKLMQRADIAVFPSYAGESFGIVLIEAMAAQSGFVLAGDNAGYRTVLGEIPESIVDVKNISAFSDKLYKILTDQKYRQNIFLKQQEIVKQYDINIVGKQVLNLYYDCLKLLNNK